MEFDPSALVPLAVAGWLRQTAGPFLAVVLLALLAGAFLLTPAGRRLFPRASLLPAGPPARPRDVFAVAALLALVTGVLEVAIQGGMYRLDFRWGSLHPHSGWMNPLSHLVFLGLAAAVPAAAAALGRPRLGTPRFAAFLLVLTGVALLAPLGYPEIHQVALAVLVVGLVVRGTTTLSSRWASAARASKRALPYAAAAVAVVGLAAPLGLQTSRAYAGRPGGPAPAGAPNVILIVLDTVRAHNLSLHGYPRPTTPEIEQFVRDGVVFDRAFATSSWTLPTHATLFTGLDAQRHGADWLAPLPDGLPTLAETFRDRGYATAGFVGNWQQAGRHTGLARGFGAYEEHVSLPIEAAMSSILARAAAKTLRAFGVKSAFLRDKKADRVSGEFLGWLDDRDDRPFFAFLNYMDAHDPYLPPPDWARRFAAMPRVDRPFHAREQRAAESADMIDAYDAEIARLDHDLGLLFDELESRGALENTLVVITSDHGEEFGEKGQFQHGRNLYSPTVHVPLAIVFPGRVPEGRRIGTPVSLTDVAATILELTGADGALPGRSLAGCWAGRPCGSESAPLVMAFTPREEKGRDIPERWQMKSLVVRDLHYILQPDGAEEIYSVVDDPWEQNDLADTPAGRAAVQRFRRFLHEPGAADAAADARHPSLDRGVAHVPGT